MPAGLITEGATIGATLRRARSRAGLDMRGVEERTKIRLKYLRALESEDWALIPSAAYAKGFLRTYANLLDLDADALVDEYRRQVEPTLPASALSPFGEHVLEGRERPPGVRGPRRPRLRIVAGLGLVALAGGVGVLVLGGSSNDSATHHGKRPAHARHAGSAQRGGGGRGSPAGAQGAAALKLHAKDALGVCLVAGDGRVLIDSQTLSAGAKAGPFTASQYRLDLEHGGAMSITLAGRKTTLRSKDPASYKLRAGEARPQAFRGPRCP
jgi:helix-turn-helix protein